MLGGHHITQIAAHAVCPNPLTSPMPPHHRQPTPHPTPALHSCVALALPCLHSHHRSPCRRAPIPTRRALAVFRHRTALPHRPTPSRRTTPRLLCATAPEPPRSHRVITVPSPAPPLPLLHLHGPFSASLSHNPNSSRFLVVSHSSFLCCWVIDSSFHQVASHRL